MKDWRNRTILPGNTILYPIRFGSATHVCEATVKEVREDEGCIKAIRTASTFRGGRVNCKVTIRRVDRVTVLR